MLELAGKMKFDGSGFHRAMSGMKAAAGPAGAQIGQQIRGKMLEAFGAAGAIALFKKSIEGAVKIKQGATKAGLDTSTFQALSIVAERAGSSVEELIQTMRDGGPNADSLSSSLKDAQEELIRTGQIIDDKAIVSLSGLSFMIEAAFGRIAPVMAGMIDFLLKLHEVGRAITQAGVALGMRVYGEATGNKTITEAANRLGLEALSGSKTFRGEEKPDAVRIAADAAARAVREDRDRSPNRTEKQAKQVQVSSLVAAGAVFNRGSMIQNRHQEIMQNEIKRIRALVERGGD